MNRNRYKRARSGVKALVSALLAAAASSTVLSAVPRYCLVAGAAMLTAPALTACAALPEGDAELTKNVYIELVDWHISGLWVINCPVAWIRVRNYNNRPVKEITIQYNTFDVEGKPLNQGTMTIENSTVGAGQVKNFAEQYVGLVDLRSEKLSVKLVSVSGD
ncbi:MAG TPA: hypothetical protein V6C72_12900 [Chroococcales cyanobacterium]